VYEACTGNGIFWKKCRIFSHLAEFFSKICRQPALGPGNSDGQWSLFGSYIHSTMGTSCPKKRDLIKNFPQKFSYSDLKIHFTHEYRNYVGHDAPVQVIDTLIRSFLRRWKKVKKKEQFLSSPSCAEWLETDVILPRQMSAGEAIFTQEKTPILSQKTKSVEAEISPVTPTILSHLKSRKPFHCLTDRGKQRRLKDCLSLKKDELQYLVQKSCQKKRRLYFYPEEQRKRDNQTCLFFFLTILI
jgi:hypothetical protein